MKISTFFGLAITATLLFAANRADAWGCRRGYSYYVPQVIYVVPPGYVPGPGTPGKQQPQQQVGAFYYSPEGSSLANPIQGRNPAQQPNLFQAYPYPDVPFEYNQPEGWWWR